jgi:peptidoglycan/LPS O-acetylase OafA/YrhL
LDGLRGLAALMVALAHYVLAFQPAMYFGTLANSQVSFPAALRIARTPLTVLFQPELAVAVFFVLSGFVLAASVTSRPAPLLELVLRRWMRLSIPILATSIGIWAMLRLGLHADRRLAPLNHSAWLDMNFSWLAWEPNDLRTVVFQAVIDVYARGRHWWNTSLWTMPIEFWGSVGLFTAYAVLRRLRAAAVWRLSIALGAYLVLWRTDYCGFAAGVALYELSMLMPPAPVQRFVWLGGAMLLVGGVLLGGTPYYDFGLTPYRRVVALLAPISDNPVLALHRIAAVVLVLAALIWLPARRVLVSASCKFLGRVSFMMYLCHVALLCSVASWVVLRLTPLVGYNAATMLALPAFLATLLPLAALATRFVDRPGTAFAHRAARMLAVRARGWRLAAIAR